MKKTKVKRKKSLHKKGKIDLRRNRDSCLHNPHNRNRPFCKKYR